MPAAGADAALTSVTNLVSGPILASATAVTTSLRVEAGMRARSGWREYRVRPEGSCTDRQVLSWAPPCTALSSWAVIREVATVRASGPGSRRRLITGVVSFIGGAFSSAAAAGVDDSREGQRQGRGQGEDQAAAAHGWLRIGAAGGTAVAGARRRGSARDRSGSSRDRASRICRGRSSSRSSRLSSLPLSVRGSVSRTSHDRGRLKPARDVATAASMAARSRS